MTEIILIGILAFTSGLCGFIGATYALKRFDFYGLFIDSIDALLGDEQNLAKAYALGQLLGRGFTDGAGLGKVKKKGKIFGVPSELILPFISKFLPKITETESSTQYRETFK